MIDRILFNGKIFTQDPQRSQVSAIAISYGRIVAIGSDDNILPLANAHTQKDNLDGKTVIPGLTDAHIHWEWVSRSLHTVDLFEVPSKQEAIERVRQRVNETGVNQWVQGRGWLQDLWDNKAFPSKADLDPITNQHPMILQAKSGHAAWVNSVALKQCGITADTPDPEGGRIVRDDSGEPTGLLFETAIGLVASQVPEPDTTHLADMMLEAQRLALSQGLTGIHDFDNPSCFKALQLLREWGDLEIRVLKQINKDWLPHALELGIRGGYGDDWIRFGGLKLFADGALGQRTALMVEPYKGEPDNYGIAVLDKEEILDLVSTASHAGLPSTVHAIGDRAVHDVLDVFESIRQDELSHGELSDTHRHRIEHVQIVHSNDLHRLAKLNIIASMQPIHATSDYEMADAYWGERSKFAYNPRVQLDQGVVVAFGSDAPIDPFDPLKGIHAAVTRQRADGSPSPDGWYPDAKITLEEAIAGFTTGPAYAANMEDRLGRISKDYLADLVVLDQDLFTISPSQLLKVQVIATMVNGEWRYGGLD